MSQRRKVWNIYLKEPNVPDNFVVYNLLSLWNINMRGLLLLLKIKEI